MSAMFISEKKIVGTQFNNTGTYTIGYKSNDIVPEQPP